MSIEAILRRAAELTAKSEEMLAEPRPEPAQEWQPAQPTRYRGYAVETLDEMLKASEARLNKRIDVLEGRFSEAVNRTHGLLDGLADEAGTALGEVERKVRDEYKSQIDALRNEVTLLRADTKAGSQPQRRKATSRLPWKELDAFITSN